IIINTLQGINKYKLVIVTVLIGLITNACLDVPLMLLFDSLGMNASYGAITAALIGYSLSILISLWILYKKYQFRFQKTLNRLPKYIISWVVFIGVIILLKQIIPTTLMNRFIQIPVLIIYGIISFLVYLYLNYKNGNIRVVFGTKVNQLLKKYFN
ncbi:MAG: polysaccharide biosynthesis C-terminal domain-containing protein, partial [Erysipelotrichaceae bacterium]|nr:polysaccharide biosynthesis C-terminal domain-containing protein [Erysipelotrichaceae bacterium]